MMRLPPGLTLLAHALHLCVFIWLVERDSQAPTISPSAPTAGAAPVAQPKETAPATSVQTGQTVYSDPEAISVSGVDSPSEIRRFVARNRRDQWGREQYFSFKDFWQRRGIEAEEWRIYSTCRADVFRLRPGKNAEPRLLLRLYD